MKQTQPDPQAQQRQTTILLLMILMTFLLMRTRPQPQPTQEPAPTVAPQAAAGLDERQAAKLTRAGAPPFVVDLVLSDPAWAHLNPSEQVAAIRKRIDNAAKDDPLLPRYHLTIAWLYDPFHSDQAGIRPRLPGHTLEAATEYSGLGRYLSPDPRAKDAKNKKKAAYQYAGQARLRAFELYRQLAEQRHDKKYLTKARRELDMVTSTLQRYGPEAITVWRREGENWVPAEDAYGYVLELADEITRDTPMYRAIDLLVRLTGGHQGWNMVLALVLLAVGLKLAMYPLSRKSYRSMAEMQKMQPVIEEIRKKHKDNPKKLNEEMMRVYSDHGINPLGGCLPMLLQIPVFIFVYQGIRAYTWRFHHVSFLWIDSLAAPDLPLLLLYGASMFVTQWLTMKRQPTSGDPSAQQMQKTMGWLMPIMFTYMMYLWNLPSAFYLYWLTFNIISTVEQTVTHGHVHGRAAEPEVVSMAVLRESSATRTSKGRKAGRAAAGKKRRSSRGG